MSCNLTLFGKVFYITPWMVYSTGVKSDDRWFAINEFDESVTVEPRKAVDNTIDEDVKEVSEIGDRVGDRVGDDVEDGVEIVEYVPEMSIGYVHEKEFTRVFPGYMSLVGLYAAGKGLKTGYRERQAIGNTLKGFLRFGQRN